MSDTSNEPFTHLTRVLSDAGLLATPTDQDASARSCRMCGAGLTRGQSRYCSRSCQVGGQNRDRARTARSLEQRADAEVLVENALFLLGSGDHPDHVVARLGTTHAALGKALYRAGRAEWTRFDRTNGARR